MASIKCMKCVNVMWSVWMWCDDENAMWCLFYHLFIAISPSDIVPSQVFTIEASCIRGYGKRMRQNCPN
jgi:hypothetical protein